MKTLARLAGPVLALLVLGAAAPDAPAAQVPPDFPAVTVTMAGDPAPGYVFLSNFVLDPSVDNVPFLMVLDNSGYPVRCKELATPINLDFKLQPDGTVTYCDAGRWVILDEDLAPIDSVEAAGGWHTDGHELRVLASGNMLTLAWRARPVDMTAYGGRANALVQDYAIQELRPDGALVWQWSTADHFQVDDATPDIPLTAAFIDYVHCNAIDIDHDGNLLLSCRHFDEITKIDRSTGDIIWRMGGAMCENNQFTFVNDFAVDQGDTLFYGFSHQHGVRRLDNDHLILFDNGNLKAPHFSRAVEYALDEAGRTATRVWEYRNSPDVAADEMGFAQRLANGNTLIGWGGNAGAVAMTEVAPDGTKLIEMTLPEGVFSYRAFRFVSGMAAVTRAVAGPGTFDFNEPGNVTGVRMELGAVAGSGNLTVQRHEYAAHDLSFAAGAVPVEVLPYRWVTTRTGLSGLDATFVFDLDTLPGVEHPGEAVVYSRPREGEGEFSPLPTVYDEPGGEIVASATGLGELIIGIAAGTGVAEPEAAPVAVRILASAPNPFARDTALGFELGRAGRVTLRVFDAAGRHVATLVDGERGPGSHAVVLDAAGLAAGVYFCRLEAGGVVASAKLTLAR